MVTDKALVGPGLAGMFDRVPSEEWAIAWIKNPQAMIAKGDPYAVKIYNEFNQAQMTAFEYLADEEIKAILDYIRNPPVKAAPVAADGGDAAVSAGKSSGTLSTSTLTYILGAIALLLLILVSVLSGVKRSLALLVSEKEGVPAPEERGVVAEVLAWMNGHRAWVAFAGLVIILILGRMGIEGLMGIGVYQGYAPEQPINFSHKIHAGQNGINCVYCHTSAEKGKAAGIPSLNVCMNCHTHVQEGPSGTTEIAKIYKALDYNPKTYGNNPTPVKWVRIHNLPDLAYFNHSQHVVAGGIACQTCHGEVENAAVLGQHSELTMGWCINCHRETNVQVTDNGYYEDLHKRTPEWHDGSPITVERIGGLECAKCHY